MPDLPGLGTQLRLLLAHLDGAVQGLYDQSGVAFRPRYFPLVQPLLGGEVLTVGELAAAARVSQPAATQTIAELVRAGLAAVHLGTDARSRLVSLTPAGRSTADALAPLWAAVARAADALDRELTHPLAQTLAEALAALDQRPFEARVAQSLANG